MSGKRTIRVRTDTEQGMLWFGGGFAGFVVVGLSFGAILPWEIVAFILALIAGIAAGGYVITPKEDRKWAGPIFMVLLFGSLPGAILSTWVEIGWIVWTVNAVCAFAVIANCKVFNPFFEVCERINEKAEQEKKAKKRAQVEDGNEPPTHFGN